MNIGFFVNDVATEHPHYTTTSLARAAVALGHTPWYIGVEDFAHDPDEVVRARASAAPDDRYASNEDFLDAVQGNAARTKRLAVSDLDVLFLRNNPADDDDRPWAQSVGLLFGQMAIRQGVLVLNDPHSLADAFNKLYFQFFPAEIRPKTLITRDAEEITQFVQDHGDKVVMKPLQGSGGENVFLVRPDDEANLNQIIEAIRRDGYVVVQEYLPAASEGDLRLFMMNGTLLRCEGHYAAMRRVREGGDLRSNIHAGGHAEAAEVTDAALHIAELVRPKLVQDGMFLVGLDVCGDKLLEVNVFSPGGLWSMEQFEEVSFAQTVIEALKRKVDIARRYRSDFSNTQLATM